VLYESIADRSCATWCTLDTGIVTATEVGDLTRAETLFEEARAAFVEVGNWRGIGLAVAKLANLVLVCGDVARSRRYLETIESEIDLIDPVAAASIASCWADIHQAEGDWRASITDLEQVVSCYERAGCPHEILGARTKLGRALVSCGRLDDASVEADRAESMFTIARPVDRVSLPRLRADIAAARGDWIEASRQLERALHSEHVLPHDETYIRLKYGELALQAGNLDSAEKELRRSAELALDQRTPVTVARALQGLATVLRRQGEQQSALDAALRCVHATESIEHVPTQTRIRRYALAVSAAQELGDSDTISVLLPHLSRLVK